MNYYTKVFVLIFRNQIIENIIKFNIKFII